VPGRSGGKSNEHDVVVSPAVSAYVATYVDGNHTKWTMVAWEWVVLRDGAKAYERIILHTAPRDGAEEQMLQLARTFLDAAV
jgi:hypothetical protein